MIKVDNDNVVVVLRNYSALERFGGQQGKKEIIEIFLLVVREDH